MTKMTCPKCGTPDVPYEYKAFVEEQYTLSCPKCGVYRAAIKSAKARYEEQVAGSYYDDMGDGARREMLED